MRTIGPRRPASSPPGDVQAGCAICGAQFYRSDLVRQRGTGLLVCQDDAEGRDAVELAEAQAEAVAHRRDHPRYRAEHFDRSELDEDADATPILDGSGYS